MNTRVQGTLTRWKDEQGFGFIIPDQGGNEVFVHVTAFINQHRRPIETDKVSYEFVVDSNGRVQAYNVGFADEQIQSPKAKGRFGTTSLALTVIAAGFLAALLGLHYFGRLSGVIVAPYLMFSVFAFIAYWRDKRAALKDRRRTPENTLHLLALLGGWPGALIAQRLFRHKSRKLSFQIVFWITVAINCGVLAWTLIDYVKQYGPLI